MKVRGPTGSQIGHSSRSVGKLRTWQRPLGREAGMQYKGTQRTRKLSTGNARGAGEIDPSQKTTLS